MVKIFCVEFQREPLKFHTKYLTHTMKDFILIQHWNFKSSQISKLISVFETPPWDIWDNESIGLTKCTGWPLVIITQGYICGTDLLVCTIKWEPLIQSLQNLIAISPWRCLLLDEILEKFCWKLFFGHFFFYIFTFWMHFFKVKHYWPYLKFSWSCCHAIKRKCIGWILGQFFNLDLSPHLWP